MDGSKIGALVEEYPSGIDLTTEEEYAEQSKLLQELTKIPSIDKETPWQRFRLATEKIYFVSSYFQGKWRQFVRNPENDSPVQLEIWSAGQIEKEFHIPQSIHGSIYTDGWFEGISWNSNETCIAYVPEEASPSKPTFSVSGYQKGCSTNKDSNNWTGQGDFEEEWGETFAGKRQPALFVINIDSGEVRRVKTIEHSLSVGQVVWAPSIGGHQYLVFVGWSSEPRKLGIMHCYNRAYALYAIKAPDYGSEVNEHKLKDGSKEDFPLYKLTKSISSAFSPRFRPDGRFLVFLSAHSSVTTGVISATNSPHRINWPTDGKLSFSENIVHVVKAATIFLLGAKDLRVPCPNGLQCARALKEKGVDVKVIMFPDDGHAISRLRSDFESNLNIDLMSSCVC